MSGSNSGHLSYNEEVPEIELKELANLALKILDNLSTFEAAVYIAHTFFNKSPKLIARQFSKSKVLENMKEVTTKDINAVINKVQKLIRDKMHLVDFDYA